MGDLVSTASPSTNAAVKSADKYIKFLEIVKSKPAEERTALMKTGMLGNMTIKDFTEMVNPPPKKPAAKKTTKKKETKKSDKVPITNALINFYSGVESIVDFLEQLEGMVNSKTVLIEQGDLDNYEKAVLMFVDTLKEMKKIGNKMKRRVIKND